jgi:cytochrome c biogenesis protein CcmG, thiol:disulfide interchange protein DsbE
MTAVRRSAVMALAALSLVAVGLVGCSSSSAPTAGTCLKSLTVPPSAGAIDPSHPVTPVAVATGRAIPRIALGCLDGSGKTQIPALDRPMIISFWATYCGPCRAELPDLAAFAKTAGDRLAVIGVDTADDQSHGRSMASDLHLAFPMLADPDTQLFKAVAAPGLPTLLFVAPGGRIAYSLSSNQVDGPTLDRLTSKYLGVAI